MMISPTGYINGFRNSNYTELIEERNKLLRFVQEFEEKELSGDRSDKEWNVNPSPDVKYQCYLDYLAKLCTLMREKYNLECVRGGKNLSEI